MARAPQSSHCTQRGFVELTDKGYRQPGPFAHMPFRPAYSNLLMLLCHIDRE